MNRFLIAALILPILALGSLTAYRALKLQTGYEMTLPVEGYDPRDLLSGHYVVYTPLYGVPETCGEYLESMELQKESLKRQDAMRRQQVAVCICYEDPTDSMTAFWQSDCSALPSTGCPVFIKGTCQYGRFEAGIERFYVPESQADAYNDIVWNEGADLTIRIDSSGQAQVVDLELPVSIEEWQARKEAEELEIEAGESQP